MARLIAALGHRARLRALAEAEVEADAAARVALAVRPAPIPVTRPLHVRQTEVTYRYIEAGVECTWSGQGRPPRSLAAQLGHPLAEWGR